MYRVFALLALSTAVTACGSAADESAPSSQVSTSETTSITALLSPTSSTIPPPTTTAIPSTTSTTTPVDELNFASLTDLSVRGPHDVGVVTLAVESGPTIEVWYPAESTPGSTETYDIRDFVPDVIRSLLTADTDSEFSYPAERDAKSEIADGTPLVLFSHGYSGMRLQSATLTSHLASWGMVVAAPDHPSRDLFNVLGGTATGTAVDSVEELITARTAVLNDDRFSGVDDSKWAAVGHSAGGSTVVRLGSTPAADGLIGIVSLAAGAPDEVDSIDVPSMFIAGGLDAVVPVDATTQALDRAPAGSILWTLADSGHNAFADFCRFGDGAGIIGVAEASGLGPLLEAQPQLRALGTDGCLPPAAPVTESDPAINAGVTAFLAQVQDRRVFDTSEPPPGPLSVDVTTS